LSSAAESKQKMPLAKLCSSSNYKYEGRAKASTSPILKIIIIMAVLVICCFF
jgi:hypothetical protein